MKDQLKEATPGTPILDSLITLNSECMSGKICVEAAREQAKKLLDVAQRTQKAVTLITLNSECMSGKIRRALLSLSCMF